MFQSYRSMYKPTQQTIASCLLKQVDLLVSKYLSSLKPNNFRRFFLIPICILFVHLFDKWFSYPVQM